MRNLPLNPSKPLLRLAALTVASFATAGTAAAQSDQDQSFLSTQANVGGYVAGAIGRSSEQVDVGSAAHAAPYEVSSSALGLQIAGGYRPVPAWSAEGGYIRLGRVSSGRSDATIDGLMLSALGYLPTPLLTLYGRVGIFHARTYGAYDSPSEPRPIPIHHYNTNLTFGVGLSTNFRHNLNLRLESQGFQVTHATNTSLFSIAIVWSFL